MPPPPVERQVAEIATDPDRAAAYARLLHLQRGCADDPSAAADLAAASPATILPLLVRDAAADDEAVAAAALKCLGFALYHPVLVSTISGQTGQLVLDTLVQLIMTTRMKAICNLGIWCISVQQLGPLIADDRVTPLLTAIVYALDNPFGSLSTTFEAVQATMKIACQNPERMRDLSSIWAPPIYRRLLSDDKTERDMAERCLTKLSSVILPPRHLLSKAVALDLEQKLLYQMMNLLDDPLKKIQAIKSWGWFISLLGSSAVNARPLLNKILKVPEKMFIDPDPQVQIATIGTWRNLVDAFFAPHASESMDQEKIISPTEPRAHGNAQLKKIRLIMLPICRVLSRSHNIALNYSCFSTWHYLLYKLGDLINHPSILEAAFGPPLKIFFSIGPDNVNKPLWSLCINLFHDFISAKFRHVASYEEYLHVPLNQNLRSQSCVHLKDLFHVQHIKWSSWDITSFEFQLEILGSIVNPVLQQNMALEMMVTVMDSATQIFRLLLQGIQVDCAANVNVQICITKACQFVKVFLDLVGKQNGDSCAVVMASGLHFVENTVEELDHSLLASGKYEILLDIKHIKEMQCAECSPKISYPGLKSLPYKEMVSPAVYMIVLSLSMVAQFRGELSQENAEKLAAIVCLFGFGENFHAAVAFLYMQIMHLADNRLRIKWLMVWNRIAKRLNKNEQIISQLKLSCGASGYDVLFQFFCYPFFAFLSSGSTLVNAQNSSESYLPVTQGLEVELAIEVYKSLFTNLDCGSEAFHKVLLEHLFEYMVSVIDENMPLFHAKLEYYSEKNSKNIAILFVLSEVVIVLLDNIQIWNYSNQELKEASEESTGCREPNLFLSCLKLVNRFMKLSHFGFKRNIAEHHQVTNRVFSSLSTFVGHLVSKKDILLLFEIIGDQLTKWLSLSGTLYSEMQQGETIDQLEKLWLKVVGCLKMSQLISDGSFLQKQHSLLQAAVNHSHQPISIATTSLWRALRPGNTSLQHPGCSVSKLDELTADRTKNFDGSKDADGAIALQELDISWNFALPTMNKRVITSDSIENTGRNGESVKMAVGLGRKRLKTMKCSIKPKEFGKNMVSPQHITSEVCRKPELILKMLKRKR